MPGLNDTNHWLASDSTALMIFLYPVHRQRFPDKASSISCLDAFGFLSKRAFEDMIMPGVQNPHCIAPWSTNAVWIKSGSPSFIKPSTVLISFPSASTAKTKQESIGIPSTSTVHDPQAPRPQPSLVPVSPNSSRKTSRSVLDDSTSISQIS